MSTVGKKVVFTTPFYGYLSDLVFLCGFFDTIQASQMLGIFDMGVRR
jgi:hypothetical protein